MLYNKKTVGRIAESGVCMTGGEWRVWKWNLDDLKQKSSTAQKPIEKSQIQMCVFYLFSPPAPMYREQ